MTLPPMITRLFRLEHIPDDAERLVLVFERSWPGWVWTLIISAAIALAIVSYLRIEGSRTARSVLASLRAAAMILAAFLLAGPMVEMPRDIVERDQVIMLLDRSASLMIADVEDGLGSRMTRDAQLTEALIEHAAWFDALEGQRDVRWFGFHEQAFALTASDDVAGPSVELGPASGRATNIDLALEQVLQRSAGRPVSAIVLMSDGRTGQPPSRALVRRLQAEGVPVMTVPLGSDEPIGDLAIQSVQAPARAFVRDRVPVVVEIDRIGPGSRAMGGRVELLDELTGERLAEATLPGDESARTVTLIAEPRLEGTASWRVVLHPDGPDLVADNNERTIEVQLVDRPLRVLYVEGYPRWEYRYLKDILVREESIESSIMLLSADRDFAQEGNVPIARLPRTREEWAQFDVIVLGDVPAGYFSPDQLDRIRGHVAESGAGLLILAGERAVPESYDGTALADLLPFRGASRLPTIGRPVSVVPAPAAERAGLLRLVEAEGDASGWPAELADPATGWARLLWVQRIDPARLKPTAEVLAQSVPRSGSEVPMPIVMQLRFGAGMSMYVATDEIWRWRFGRGDFYVEQFWIQLIRALGRESLTRGSERAVLAVHPRRVEARQPVRIDLTLLDPRLMEELPEVQVAIVEDEQGERIAEIELRADPDGPQQRSGTWLPDRSGAFRIRVEGLSEHDVRSTAALDVATSDEELRRPETDHPLLVRLSSETRGEVFSPDSISAMNLRDRSVRTPAPIRERIWDGWAAFLLLLGIVAAEWVGRRFLRLP